MADKEITAEIDGRPYKVRMDVPAGATDQDIQDAVGEWFQQQAGPRPAPTPQQFAQTHFSPVVPPKPLAATFWEQANPAAVAKGMWESVRHPGLALNAWGGQFKELANRAQEAYKRGDYAEAGSHALNLIFNAAPGLGKTADDYVMAAGKYGMNSAEARSALGEFLGSAASMEEMKYAPKAAKGAVKGVVKAAPIVSAGVKAGGKDLAVGAGAMTAAGAVEKFAPVGEVTKAYVGVPLGAYGAKRFARGVKIGVEAARKEAKARAPKPPPSGRAPIWATGEGATAEQPAAEQSAPAEQPTSADQPVSPPPPRLPSGRAPGSIAAQDVTPAPQPPQRPPVWQGITDQPLAGAPEAGVPVSPPEARTPPPPRTAEADEPAEEPAPSATAASQEAVQAQHPSGRKPPTREEQIQRAETPVERPAPKPPAGEPTPATPEEPGEYLKGRYAGESEEQYWQRWGMDRYREQARMPRSATDPRPRDSAWLATDEGRSALKAESDGRWGQHRAQFISDEGAKAEKDANILRHMWTEREPRITSVKDVLALGDDQTKQLVKDAGYRPKSGRRSRPMPSQRTALAQEWIWRSQHPDQPWPEPKPGLKGAERPAFDKKVPSPGPMPPPPSSAAAPSTGGKESTALGPQDLSAEETPQGPVSPPASRAEQVIEQAAQSSEDESDLSAKLQASADAAMERIRQRGTFSGTKLHAGLPLDDIADMTIWGAAKMAKGVVDFGQWSKEMVGKFGEQIRPHLEDLYSRAKKAWTRGSASVKPPATPSAIRDVGDLIDNPLNLKGKGLTHDLGAALDKTVKAKQRLGPESDPERRQVRAAEQMTKDVEWGLKNLEGSRGWYTKMVQKMEATLAEHLPAFRDAANRALFKYLLAITSNGVDPETNFAAARKGWEMYERDGYFSAYDSSRASEFGNPKGTGLTFRANSYESAMGRLNQVLTDKGSVADAIQWLKTKHPVSELKKYNKDVPGKATDMRYGSYIFGEKVGSFGANLNGIHTELTADKWWSRSWNRWMGTVIKTDAEGNPVLNKQTGLPELQDDPRNEGERNLMRETAAKVAADLGLDVDELQAVLWYTEQQLYRAHGIDASSIGYDTASESYFAKRGIQPAEAGGPRPPPRARGATAQLGAAERGAPEVPAGVSTTGPKAPPARRRRVASAP